MVTMRPRRTALTSGDVEFLSDAGAQDSDQVIGVFAGEGGAVSRDFVGDPSAAGHEDVDGTAPEGA